MPHTTGKRYAVVSCHVERPLDDEVWSRFSALQERRPGGFAIAALMRPADIAAGEDEARWAERAREAAARGPLGHHTHWTAPDHARPTAGGTAERVLAEGNRLRELGLAPTLFCGGGWYTNPEVADACAELGYLDCTPRASRPSYLQAGEPWASLAVPARIRLPSGRVLPAIPTTHSLGGLARRLYGSGLKPTPFVHAYFHDTDLLEFRRRAAIHVVLEILGRRGRLVEPTDLDALAMELLDGAPEVDWAEVAQT